MHHVLIIGGYKVGKSTLIQRILKELKRPIYGFETRKEPLRINEEIINPIYIYEAGGPYVHSSENLLGYCSAGEEFKVNAGAFDRFAPKLARNYPSDSVIVFDELGFMEEHEIRFQEAVLSRLDGDIPVIAAVKDVEGFNFLSRVRAHPNCQCFSITAGNREERFQTVLDYIKEQWYGEECHISSQ